MIPGMNPELTINWDFFILLFFINLSIVLLLGFGYRLSIQIRFYLHDKELKKRNKWIVGQILKNPTKVECEKE